MGFFKQKAVYYEDDTTSNIEQVLERLHKQTRYIESLSAPLNNFTPSVSRMMHSQISKLKLDNSKMKKQLIGESANVARLTENNEFTDEDVQRMERDDEIDEWYHQKTQQKCNKINQLEKVAEEIHYGIMERRRERGGINAAQDNIRKLDKQISMFDSRLHRARLDFNRKLTDNRHMREKIENMRIERIMVDRQIEQLLQCISKESSLITNVLEEATKRSEKRDASVMQVALLKKQAMFEHRKFQEEWHGMGRLVSYNIKIIEHIQMLSDKRLIKNKERWARVQETEMQNIMTAAAWDIAKDRACIKVSEKRIAIYEQLFKRLEEATKVKGMQELVAVFENSEDRNFQKFQIVNDISNQIEEIEEELQKNNKVRTVLSDAQEHGDGGSVQEKELKEKLVSQSAIEDLQQKIQVAEAKLKELDEHKADHENTKKNLKRGIERIKLLFEPGDKVMKTTMVTESSLMDHLSEMEEHISRVLQIYVESRNLSSNFLQASNHFDITQPTESPEVDIKLPTSIRPENGVFEPNIRPYESDTDEECDMPTFITQKRRQKSHHTKKVKVSVKVEEPVSAKGGDDDTDAPVADVDPNANRQKAPSAPMA